MRTSTLAQTATVFDTAQIRAVRGCLIRSRSTRGSQRQAAQIADTLAAPRHLPESPHTAHTSVDSSLFASCCSMLRCLRLGTRSVECHRSHVRWRVLPPVWRKTRQLHSIWTCTHTHKPPSANRATRCKALCERCSEAIRIAGATPRRIRARILRCLIVAGNPSQAMRRLRFGRRQAFLPCCQVGGNGTRTLARRAHGSASMVRVMFA